VNSETERRQEKRKSSNYWTEEQQNVLKNIVDEHEVFI